MKSLFVRERYKGALIIISKFTWRAAVIIITTATILFGTLLFNSEVRAAVRKVIVEWYEHFTSFTFKDDISNNNFKYLYPGYLPDGYSEDTVIDLGNIVRIIFMNDVGDEIRFSYKPDSFNSNISVDNENHLIEEILLNGNIAFIIISLDKDFDNGVILNTDGYVIELWGMMAIDNLILIADSIFEIKQTN